MTAADDADLSRAVAQYALRLGDDALILAQRLSWWCSRAPELESDVAFANIALDQLGVARALLSYAGEPAGRDEDSLAYLREDREYRNCLLVELPDRDFARTVTKLLFVAAYQVPLYAGLAGSVDDRLAGVAGKAVKESAYHLEHARLWTLRLGDGTAESHRRMQAAVDELWPYTAELFEADAVTSRLATAGVGVDPAGLRPAWQASVAPVLAEATLATPTTGWAPSGGRHGRHTEELAYLLAEMQVVHRAHPGARW
ncbi:MAG TPA: 1,2-phenylacetyl-CoA epoxidase subunit PaaC [Micromonosporaceae bacterium]|nr:1,2-phenylacetyl-CoA epoxidase subunit PaaC [Micromonosporaceae bacterium]